MKPNRDSEIAWEATQRPTGRMRENFQSCKEHLLPTLVNVCEVQISGHEEEE